MAGILDLWAVGRDPNALQRVKGRVVLSRQPPPLRVRRIQTRQLLNSDRRLDVGHVVLEAQLLNLVVPTSALLESGQCAFVDSMPAQEPGALFNFRVTRGQQASFPRRHVLDGMKAEA